MTVLFCDIVGSTRIAEKIGAEQMHRQLSSFFEATVAEVHRFGGTINQFLGDGFMALFGAPTMHEDHALRAALTAIAIREASRHTDRSDIDTRFQLRMGVHSGQVVVGTIGDKLRTDYTAIGDTTNTAARLQQEAAPGTILVSEGIYRALHGHAEFQSLGTRLMKGKSEPFPVYRLVRMLSTPERVRDADRASATIVGRATEMDAIRKMVGDVEQGRGGALVIVGDAGLGKSRLVAEAGVYVRQRQIKWAEGYCLSFGRTLSYWPFREAIRNCFDANEGDDESVVFERIQAVVERLFGNTAEEVLPFIGALLALPLPSRFEKQLRLLDALAIGHQISRATLRLFERLALQEPIVLVLEDWHWADASSAELLEHLLPLADRVPILFIIACRPEAQGAADSLRRAIASRDQSPRNAQELVLASLDVGDARTLVENLLGSSRVPIQVRDLLLARSRGNPFYLGELIRTLIAAHGLERNAPDGEWQVTERFATIPLPDTIEGVILARVDRLDEEVKHTLKSASVIGRTFFYRLLRSIITTSESSLKDHLSKLTTSDLIEENATRPELEFSFRHPLIQQATYDSMIGSRRRDLHRDVAQTIERIFDYRLEHFYSVLAYHFARAEEWPRAQHYLFMAAEHADRLAADQEALELYEAVIATAQLHPETSLDPLQRAQLDFKIGDAHFRAGRHEQALRQFALTLRRFGQEPPKRRVYLSAAVVAGLSGYMLRRFRSGATNVSDTMSATETLCCQVMEASALIHFFTDPLHCVYDSLRLASISRRHMNSRAHILGLSLIGMTFTALGFYRTAEWSLNRARALANTYGEDWQQAMVDHFHALHNYHIGNWEVAVRLAEGAAERCWKSGNIRLWSAVLGNQLTYLNSLGDPKWLMLAERFWQIVSETSDRQALAWSLSGMTMAQEHRGEFELALDTVRKAIDIYSDIPDPRLLAHALGLRSALLLKLDRRSEAVGCCEQAAVLIVQHQLSGSWTTRPLIAIAEARIAQFERSSDSERVEAGRVAAAAVHSMLRQGKKVRDDGASESLRIAGTYAWINGDPERAKAFWRKGVAEARSLGARHAEAKLHLEQGRRTGGLAELDEARTLFAAAGASHEERIAQELAFALRGI